VKAPKQLTNKLVTVIYEKKHLFTLISLINSVEMKREIELSPILALS